MVELKPIQTEYRGYRFRSRLEARWAVFFDAAKIEWEYEREGFELPSGRYLPDFWLPTRHIEEYPDAGTWVDIKPRQWADERESLLKRMEELTIASKHTSMIFSGDPGDFYTLSFSYSRREWLKYSIDDIAEWPSEYHTKGEWFTSMAVPGYIGNAAAAIKAARSARFEFGETP